MPGVLIWHGLPGCGKSTAMREYVTIETQTTGNPVLVVDPARVPQWADLPHAVDAVDAIAAAWGEGEHVALSTNDPEELGRLARAANAARDVTIVVDELRPFASSYSVGEDLVVLARQHRHARVTLLLGTQSIGDVRTDLLAAATVIYHGRVASPRLLEYLRREYGLDPAQLQQLGRGEWVKTRMGF